MATQPQRSDATVILRDETDYRNWYSQLQSRCIAYDVWAQVDPYSTTTPLIKPLEPDLPEISEYTPTQGFPADRAPARLSELSNTGQRAYKEDLEVYKLQLERYKSRYAQYKTETTSLQQIVLFIQSSVAPHLQRTCCLPDTPIKQWIRRLKDTVGIDTKLELQQANDRYQAALKPPRTPAIWNIWLARYDQAATEAETLGVPNMTKIEIVANDFISSVNKIAPNWALTFQNQGLYDSTMTRKEMMKRFREAMALNHPASQKSAFVTDASLLRDEEITSTHEGDAFHAEAVNSSRKRGRSELPRGGPKGGKKPPPYSTPVKAGGRLNSVKADGRKCNACSMNHTLNECFYLHPELAPEWWKPSTRIEELVKLKLEYDLDFQGLLRGQSRPRSKTPAMKQSHTPTPEITEQ